MAALSGLREDQKKFTLPIVELVMPKPDSSVNADLGIESLYPAIIKKFLEKSLSDIPEQIQSTWGNQSIIVDFSLLYTDVRQQAVIELSKKCSAQGLNIIPLVNMEDSRELKQIYLDVVQKYDLSLCIRITPSLTNDPATLNGQLERYLAKNPKSGKTILFFDLKEDCSIHSYKKALSLCQGLIHLNEWQEIILSSGSFPKDMGAFKIDEDNYVTRLDWQNWITSVKSGELKRVPVFSDYGIRYPIYTEESQFRGSTATIKYTLEDRWIIFKGERNKNVQYLGHAKLLVELDLYSGEAFSWGDKYIAEKAIHYDVYVKDPKVKGTGSSSTWISAGMNHHFSVVLDQISSSSFAK